MILKDTLMRKYPKKKHRFQYKRNKPKHHHPQRRNEQAIILSGLDVLRPLEAHTPQYLQGVLHYGPETFVGKRSASALIWYRRKGYHHYRKLMLFGVWVAEIDSVTHIIIGSKSLTYTATIYNPESYTKIMKQTFIPYYGNDVSPPDKKGILFQTDFDVTRRLALRRELAEQLAYWFKNRLFT